MEWNCFKFGQHDCQMATAIRLSTKFAQESPATPSHPQLFISLPLSIFQQITSQGSENKEGLRQKKLVKDNKSQGAAGSISLCHFSLTWSSFQRVGGGELRLWVGSRRPWQALQAPRKSVRPAKRQCIWLIGWLPIPEFTTRPASDATTARVPSRYIINFYMNCCSLC